MFCPQLETTGPFIRSWDKPHYTSYILMFVSYMHPLLLFISISTFLLVYACFLFSSICFLVKLPYLLFEHVIDVFSIQRLQEPRRKKDRLYSPMIFCQMPRCECSKIIGQIKSKSRPFPSFHPVHSIYIYIYSSIMFYPKRWARRSRSPWMSL